MAVEYAEAELGRYTGDKKWTMALELLDKLGFDIDSDEVIAALKAKWLELNLAQVAAGVKDVIVDSGTDTNAGNDTDDDTSQTEETTETE